MTVWILTQVIQCKQEIEMAHMGPIPCIFNKQNCQVLINIKKLKIVFKIRKDYGRIIFFLIAIKDLYLSNNQITLDFIWNNSDTFRELIHTFCRSSYQPILKLPERYYHKRHFFSEFSYKTILTFTKSYYQTILLTIFRVLITIHFRELL